MGRPSKLKNAPKEIQDKVVDLNRKGFSYQYIATTLCETGLKIDQRSVKRFLDSLGKETQHDRKWEKSDHVNFEETKTGQDTFQDVIVVDIDQMRNDYGLSDDLTKPENVIGNIQRLASEIVLLEQMICLKKLQAYSQGKCKHPNEAIRGYKVAYEVFSDIYGVNDRVNVNAAMQTLEKYYGDLQSLKQIEEITDKEDTDEA